MKVTHLRMLEHGHAGTHTCMHTHVCTCTHISSRSKQIKRNLEVQGKKEKCLEHDRYSAHIGWSAGADNKKGGNEEGKH